MVERRNSLVYIVCTVNAARAQTTNNQRAACVNMAFEKCCICQRCEPVNDPDSARCANAACKAFLCGWCVCGSYHAVYCPLCPTTCRCNWRMDWGHCQTNTGKCDDCKCAHTCSFAGTAVAVCPVCINTPPPKDANVLSWWTPPDTRGYTHRSAPRADGK